MAYAPASLRYWPGSSEDESAVRSALYDIERYAYAIGYNAGFGLGGASRNSEKDLASKLRHETTRMKRHRFPRWAIERQIAEYTRIARERRAEGGIDGARDRRENPNRYRPRLHH